MVSSPAMFMLTPLTLSPLQFFCLLSLATFRAISTHTHACFFLSILLSRCLPSHSETFVIFTNIASSVPSFTTAL